MNRIREPRDSPMPNVLWHVCRECHLIQEVVELRGWHVCILCIEEIDRRFCAERADAFFEARGERDWKNANASSQTLEQKLAAAYREIEKLLRFLTFYRDRDAALGRIVDQLDAPCNKGAGKRRYVTREYLDLLVRFVKSTNPLAEKKG